MTTSEAATGEPPAPLILTYKYRLNPAARGCARARGAAPASIVSVSSDDDEAPA